jgi:exonuclease SbcD
MKLLVTGDWHYRSQNPVARLDDFQSTLNAKLHEVGQIAYDHDVEAIVVPGDVFDSPSPAYSTLTSLERIIKDNGRQVWAVPGNHDEHAHSLESLERTAYGHLAATGMIRDLAASPAEMDTVTVSGTGFSADTDTDVSDYLVKIVPDATENSVKIHVAHGMLLEHAPGFELKHTLLGDVAKHPHCPDVLICGHEHLGFGVRRIPRARGGELVAINPGALVRLSAHPGEIERMPQVCLLEVYPGVAPSCEKCGKPLTAAMASRKVQHGLRLVVCDCLHENFIRDYDYGPPEIWSISHPVIEATLIPLSCARPGHEVLSRQHIEQAADREAKMGEFLSLLAREGEARFLDIQAIVEAIAHNENLPRPVVDEALRRIAAAREALGGRRSA